MGRRAKRVDNIDRLRARLVSAGFGGERSPCCLRGQEKQEHGENPLGAFSWVLKSRCPLKVWVLGSCSCIYSTLWDHHFYHPAQKLNMFAPR